MTLLAGTTADATVPGALGASGAIAAVLGAYWILYPGARILTIVGTLPYPHPRLGAPSDCGSCTSSSRPAPGFSATARTGGTAFFAHVGGFVFGAAVAIALVRSGRRDGRFAPLQPAT